ncbi:MAG TPA: hypothetical protein VKT78_05605, partial [Fimbriimonadaceae bacterium]|nr:hypothetical protein [Fimbriimonadaceae bacterium]
MADEWQRVEAISVCIYTAAFVLSFLFLFYQLKGLQRQTRSNTVQGYWDTWIEIDRWFVQNSHLRPYFYHGKDLD